MLNIFDCNIDLISCGIVLNKINDTVIVNHIFKISDYIFDFNLKCVVCLFRFKDSFINEKKILNDNYYYTLRTKKKKKKKLCAK